MPECLLPNDYCPEVVTISNNQCIINVAQGGIARSYVARRHLTRSGSPVVPARARRRRPGGLARPRAAVLGRHSRLFNSNGSLAQALEVCRVQTAPEAVVVEGFALCGINDDFFHGLVNHI